MASPNRNNLAGIAPKLAQLTEEVLFGDIWARSELSPRERSLITLAALTALGRERQLPWHIDFAASNGLTRAEITEVSPTWPFMPAGPRPSPALSCLPPEELSMPLTRITIRAGYDDEWTARLSRAISSNSGGRVCGAPRRINFQFIDVLPDAQRIVAPHYLSGGRSGDFVLFSYFCRQAAQQAAEKAPLSAAVRPAAGRARHRPR
ncbi:4-carboxymuconolactone decarboxylase [Raoultella terrigena]|uniref:4-carboxymuconolactone decarboxylase n=1 Tax=Raoultella terrigena TaxID=577 RepID=A0A3P8KXM5_RAOTE|nr:4-carboxymuconolactone decarboxylase [Raoultella terrigena]